MRTRNPAKLRKPNYFLSFAAFSHAKSAITLFIELEEVISGWREDGLLIGTHHHMNTKDIKTKYIRDEQVLGAIEAAAFAYHNGTPLTRFNTYNIEPRFLKRQTRPQDFINSITKVSGDWLSFNGSKRANLYVVENPPGKAINIHMLSHVPDELRDPYSKMEKSWAKLAGLGRVKGAIDRQWLGGWPKEFDYACNVSRVLLYMLKGARPEICEIIGRDHEYQGEVTGKRIGWSESVGKAARNRNKFVMGQSMFSIWICPEWKRLQATCV